MKGYSIEWSQDPDEQPDEDPDLSGSQPSMLFIAPEDGEWYLHFRTQGLNGRWSDTVHVGPFVITTALTH